MTRQLKVFRTPIGFEDAHVAAPAGRQRLKRGGADANLFARVVAEEVTDPALMKEPLDSPGTGVRIIRGTVEEHMAALPPSPKARETTARAGKKSLLPPPRAKPRRRHSREVLNNAEGAMEAANAEHAAARSELDAQIATLEKRLAQLDQSYQRRAKDLEGKRALADERHQADMDAWRKSK